MSEPAEKIKAALTGEPGLGQDYLPVETANAIIEQIREKSWLRQLIGTPIRMPTNIMKFPKITGDIVFEGRYMSDGETPIGSQAYGSDTVQLELQTVAASLPIGNKLVAYGIDALMPSIRKNIAYNLAETEQNMVINGDIETGNSYADNINGAYDANNNPRGITGAKDNKLMWDGLRKINFRAVDAGKIVNVDAGGNELIEDKIVEAFAGLGTVGIDRSELVMWVPPEVGTKMLLWDSVKTIDKYGVNATIVKGEVGKIFNVPIIETGAIPTNLNAVGKYDGTTTDKTVAIIAHKNSMMLGEAQKAERRFAVKFKDEPLADLFYLIPQEDLAFNMEDDATVIQITNILA